MARDWRDERRRCSEADFRLEGGFCAFAMMGDRRCGAVQGKETCRFGDRVTMRALVALIAERRRGGVEPPQRDA